VSENNEATITLLQRLSEVRVEFDLSASDNLMAPSLPISFTVHHIIEHETKQVWLQVRLSAVSVVFDLSTSDNWMAPSTPICCTVLVF
jgi:hypothetical protein